MQEQLLHFLWHRKHFNLTGLHTTCGQRVEILHPGIPNQDQGPDFLQARIRIDDQIWAGHVEIHVRSSMWYLHAHDKDPHYNNVILHVVWQEDEPVKTMLGAKLFCLELNDRVDGVFLERYRHLMNNEEWVPCATSLKEVPELIRTSWLERLMVERLERKTDYIQGILARCDYDYERAFFVMLARNLGAPANSDAMENLGLKAPLNLLRKHGDRIDQIEAILFGVAGMLEKEINTGYPQRLKKEFDFLKAKYALHIIPGLQWKFMRMRPAHFPTVRIAQLAVIISNSTHFITLLTQYHSSDEWMRIFMVQPGDAYWDTHYHFKSEAPPAEKKLGKETAGSLMINLVVPFMFFYGKMQGLDHLKERALQLLRELPPEKNAIISGWKKCNWTARDASHSQSLLQLKKHYCDTRRCLHCAIGMNLLK